MHVHDYLKFSKIVFGGKKTQGIVLPSCRWNKEEKKIFTIMGAVELFKRKGECRTSIFRVVVVKHRIG